MRHFLAEKSWLWGWVPLVVQGRTERFLAVQVWGPFLVGIVILGCAYLGIASRPLGTLAAFWPANAVLLGLLLRFRTLRSVQTLFLAAVAYFVADFSTGSTLHDSIWLNVANLSGVVAGLAVAILLKQESPVRITVPDLARLVCITAVATVVATSVGIVHTYELASDRLPERLAVWSSSEFSNYMVVLPLFLFVPGGFDIRSLRLRNQELPLLVLFLGLILSVSASGPGALVFPLPGLLWLALNRQRTLLAGAIVVAGAVTLIWPDRSVFDSSGSDLSTVTLASLRFGVSLLVLGPLAVAAWSEAQQDSISKLHYLAETDSLSGLLNRRALTDRAALMLQDAASRELPVSVLMMDLDGFKTINDQLGHAEGDRAIEITAQGMRNCLPSGSLLCRYGGDEFVAIVAGSPDALKDIHLPKLNDYLAAETQPNVARALSISIGISWTSQPDQCSIDDMLAAADAALYSSRNNPASGLHIVEIGPHRTYIHPAE